ncbi:MAG: Na/Pi cotransporter family protein [Chloroflexi bacterium]|nr:Na/Pi cotransporter family protein [Chloroflexota bacterium]
MALFLFGVRMLSTGMEKLAGNQIQEWLDRMTSKPIKGAIFGAAATALIQSSSLLMVTMIGLINANLMTLEQAIGVMMGQEIGTTLTAQIVAFKIGDFCLLFVALGFALIEFAPQRGWREYGEIILGFGILFLGMNLMSGALKSLAEMPAVATWLASMGQDIAAGVLAGTIATAVIQSSSAITGLVVAMGISGAVTLPGAIALLLSANIGTCITGLIASSRLSRSARRASIAQIIINVIGVLLFLPFISPFTTLVSRTSPNLPRQIANAHTIFNVAVSVILFPFVRYIARAANLLVPKSAEEEKPKLTAYIDERQHRLPPVALTEAVRELNRIGEVTAEMIDRGRQALVEGDTGAAQWVLEQESEFVDPVCVILEHFVNRLMQGNLSVNQQKRCFQLKSLITDIERVGDLTEDLAQAAQKKIAHNVRFSPQATEDLNQLCQHTHRTYACALQALQDGDQTLARRACRLEDELDELYLEARQGHIDRLETGICQPEANVIFIETLRNLERISDHADNLGISVMRT